MIENASRLLIINADDFGYNDAITHGILKGYREGLITSTSAMMNLPGTPQRLAAAHASDPDLPIGLHLNLTTGRPVLPPKQVPHLVSANGAFLPFEAFLRHLFDAPLDEIRSEIHAQARIIIECGIPIDHIDYHQHILALNASLFDLVVELAEIYRVPVRQPVSKFILGQFKIEDIANLGRMSRELGGVFLRTPRHIPDFVLQIYTQRHLRSEAAKLGSLDWFINAFFRNPTLANFTTILRQLPLGLSELVVHPALESQELYTMEEGYRQERARELAVMLDPRARAEVDRQGVRLTDFSSVHTDSFNWKE